MEYNRKKLAAAAAAALPATAPVATAPVATAPVATAPVATAPVATTPDATVTNDDLNNDSDVEVMPSYFLMVLDLLFISNRINNVFKSNLVHIKRNIFVVNNITLT